MSKRNNGTGKNRGYILVNVDCVVLFTVNRGGRTAVYIIGNFYAYILI